MGTLLSEVDDASIFRKGPTARHHCSFKLLSVLAAKPPALSGLSRSDLVLWRISEVLPAVFASRLRLQSGLYELLQPPIMVKFAPYLMPPAAAEPGPGLL
jgi:hypothetical protein